MAAVYPREGRMLARACASLLAEGDGRRSEVGALERALEMTLRSLDVPEGTCPQHLHPNNSDGVRLRDVQVAGGALIAEGWTEDVSTFLFTPLLLRATRGADHVALELRVGLDDVRMKATDLDRAWRRDPFPDENAPWRVVVLERLGLTAEPESDWGRAFEAFLARPGRWHGLVPWAEAERVLPIDRDWTVAYGVTEDGRVRRLVEDGPGAGTTEDVVGPTRIGALVAGARRYGWLDTWIPARPPDARVCGWCEGRSPDWPPPLICGECGGIGWR